MFAALSPGLLAAAEPGTYFGWGPFVIQLGNAIVIVVMLVLFALAILLPFPKPKRRR
jgi:hypothetical protein